MAFRSLSLLLLCLCTIIAACGASARPGASTGQTAVAPAKPCAPSSSAPSLPGELLETSAKTLDLLDRGRRIPIACTPSATTYFAFPAFAPDGRSIAYALSTTPTSLGQDWGDDIYTAGVDGSQAKMVLEHDAPGASIGSLAWTTDGSALVYGYLRSLYTSAGQFAGTLAEVRRLSLADGAVSTLIKNAAQPSLSWDGRQMVFVAVSPNNPNVSALAIANLDGSGLRAILNTHAGFQSYYAPHLSPDGSRVVFAAIGGPVGGLDNGLQAAAGPPSRPESAAAPSASDPVRRLETAAASRLAVPPAEADGTPYEVWVADLDGSNLHPVATLREDLPFPLWSADGKQILFLGSAALYLASAGGSGVKQIDKGVPHGQIAWYQP